MKISLPKWFLQDIPNPSNHKDQTCLFYIFPWLWQQIWLWWWRRWSQGIRGHTMDSVPVMTAILLTSISSDCQDDAFSKSALEDVDDSDWDNEGCKANELGVMRLCGHLSATYSTPVPKAISYFSSINHIRSSRWFILRRRPWWWEWFWLEWLRRWSQRIMGHMTMLPFGQNSSCPCFESNFSKINPIRSSR